MRHRVLLLAFLFPSALLLACEAPLSAPSNLTQLDQRISTLQGCLSREGGLVLISDLAWANFEKGNLTSAENLFETVLKEPSAGPRDAVGYALTLLELNRAEDAHIWAVRGATGPWRALAHFVDGQSQSSLNRSTEALAAYSRALESDPLFAEARPFRARLLESAGDADGAWKEYDRVLSVDPRNARIKAAATAVALRLTRPSEELIPRKHILDHHEVAVPPLEESGPLLRVGLGTDARGRAISVSSVTFQSAGSFRVVDSIGQTLLRGGPKESWTLIVVAKGVRFLGPGRSLAVSSLPVTLQAESPESTVIIRDLPFATGFIWAGRADREVRGAVEIHADSRGVRLVNRLPLEPYVYGVLPAEMPARFPMEALKAQAVLARSYALFQRNARRPHRAQGYDLCDEQHCQVYGGVALEQPRATEAVNATRGQFLSHNGRPVHAVYSSNCGGFSQSGMEIGWGSVPYWVGELDVPPGVSPSTATAYCAPSLFTEPVKSEWIRLAFVEDVLQKVSRLKEIGGLQSIAVASRGASGRVTALTIAGSKNWITLTNEATIRRVLGLAPLRSTLFDVETIFRNDRPAFFLIHGRGWGHGVGLCQSGAAGRAGAGQSYLDILAHYFPATRLTETTRRKT